MLSTHHLKNADCLSVPIWESGLWVLTFSLDCAFMIWHWDIWISLRKSSPTRSVCPAKVLTIFSCLCYTPYGTSTLSSLASLTASIIITSKLVLASGFAVYQQVFSHMHWRVFFKSMNWWCLACAEVPSDLLYWLLVRSHITKGG